MTGMGQALDGYLDLRRGLGFKLARDEKLLRQYIAWPKTAARSRSPRTTRWHGPCCPAGMPRAGSGRACRWCARSPATWPRSTRPPRSRRPGAARGAAPAVPYLYSDADIAALMAQARHLRTPLRPATFTVLAGLLVVTGVRIGEAIALDDSDFDPERQLLLVRNAKFGRDRLLPLHPSAAAAVQATGTSVTRCSPGLPARRCSCPAREPGFGTTTSASRSPAWPGRPALLPVPAAPGPASMTQDIPSPLPRCWLAPRRRQRRGKAPAAVRLPRPRRSFRHVLVPAGFA